jgi:methylthioribose-1-phosphate isomerase
MLPSKPFSFQSAMRFSIKGGVISTPYTTLPVAGKSPVRSGKVRDLYDFGDALLLVASDRISAFDVVFDQPIPGKGIVLTALTDFWLTKTAHIVSNHRITSDVDRMPMLAPADRERLRGRAMLCRKAKPMAFEWVVRGYLAGSGWNDYKKTGRICGIALPPGLVESSRLPQPILTPTTKEESGHDRPVEFEEVEESLGRETARRVRDLAISIYQYAAAVALERGILIADTKFEFATTAAGEILLIDEVLTPDSSRFWPADRYQPGRGQPSFDKQFVRDYLNSTDWDKNPPAPPLPEEIIRKTAEKYEEICVRLTGGSSVADPSAAWGPTVDWRGEIPGTIVLLDQTRLPAETRTIECNNPSDLHHAIHRLAVRGAPAIGVAAGYGVALGLQSLLESNPSRTEFSQGLENICKYLKSARPTAVNLAWAVDRVARRVRAAIPQHPGARQWAEAALDEARRIHREDRERCDRIGAFGAALIRDGDVLLTHCNAGALATAGIGTALGVFYTAARQGKKITVFAGETRPLLQGARLTAYELQRAGIPVRVITDGMAAHVMRTQRIAAVVVGADRIASNGDTANKIGTCTLAIAAKYYNIPFYVAAPLSTFDLSIPDGSGIPIEERSSEEIVEIAGTRVAPRGVDTFNPAFDVTPATLIEGIITDAGVASPPNRETIAALFGTRQSTS